MESIILAGGIGSRLSPLSTEENPKQFLRLFNEKSLLANTLERIAPVSDTIHISTRKQWTPHIQRDAHIPVDINLILEPCGRNTGPAIAYCISKLTDDTVVGFFPSDHFIDRHEQFVRAVRIAIDLVKKNDTVVLFGITPTEACTEFGYIHYSDNTILAFKEKPEESLAEQYLASGKYLWNSGMFFFRVGKMKELFKIYAKQLHDWLEHDRTDETFALLEKISIDHAVMEKIEGNELQVVPCSFTWSDLGSFTAIEKLLGPTELQKILKIAAATKPSTTAQTTTFN